MNHHADVPLPPDRAAIDTVASDAAGAQQQAEHQAEHQIVALWMQTWGTPGRQSFSAWRAAWRDPADGAARSADHATVASWLQTWGQLGRQPFGAWIAAGNGHAAHG